MSWILGLVLGIGAGLLNAYLLFKDFDSMFRQSPTAPPLTPPQRFGMASKFFLRYLFLALLFYGAYKIQAIHFIGFVLGFFIAHVCLAVLFIRYIRKNSKKK